MDVATRFVWLKALPSKENQEVALALYDIFAHWGMPKTLVSDNGSEFANRRIAALTKLMHIDHRFTAVYHPQANGFAESRVKTVKAMLNKLREDKETNWYDHLAQIAININNEVNTKTQSRPFDLLFGRPFLANNHPASTRDDAAALQQLHQFRNDLLPFVADAAADRGDATNHDA